VPGFVFAFKRQEMALNSWTQAIIMLQSPGVAGSTTTPGCHFNKFYSQKKKKASITDQSRASLNPYIKKQSLPGSCL
jgi:hypothetical protein